MRERETLIVTVIQGDPMSHVNMTAAVRRAIVIISYMVSSRLLAEIGP